MVEMVANIPTKMSRASRPIILYLSLPPFREEGGRTIDNETNPLLPQLTCKECVKWESLFHCSLSLPPFGGGGR